VSINPRFPEFCFSNLSIHFDTQRPLFGQKGTFTAVDLRVASDPYADMPRALLHLRLCWFGRCIPRS